MGLSSRPAMLINHVNVLSEYLEPHTSPSADPPDEVLTHPDEGRAPWHPEAVLIVDRTAAHKLPLPNLRAKLRDLNLDEFLTDPHPPPQEDQTACFIYQSTRIAAAAVTRLYHYLVRAGLDYGYTSMAEAFVFVRVDWDKPGVAYYHLAELAADVAGQPTDVAMCSAVAQVLGFTLIAMRTPTRTNAERHRLISQVPEWRVDLDDMLWHMPSAEQRLPSSESKYAVPTSPSVARSPIIARYRNRHAARATEPGVPSTESRTRSASASRDLPPLENASASTNPAKRPASDTMQPSPSQPPHKRERPTQGSPQHSFCTQKCLLGLQRGEPLDSQCPNYQEHRTSSTSKASSPGRHELDIQGVREALVMQFQQTLLGDDFLDLENHGSYGALFQVKLWSHGYTFAGKAAPDNRLRMLEHEQQIYYKLEQLQGVCIPVSLGIVHLPSPYYYDLGVDLTHVLLLSWAGTPVKECDKDIKALQRKCLLQLEELGLYHGDWCERHVFYNDELESCMAIDFGEAKWREPSHQRHSGLHRSLT